MMAGELAVTIKAARTKGGYLGQVLVGDSIVWEDEDGYYQESQALYNAKYRLIDRLVEILKQPTQAEIDDDTEAEAQS